MASAILQYSKTKLFFSYCYIPDTPLNTKLLILVLEKTLGMLELGTLITSSNNL